MKSVNLVMNVCALSGCLLASQAFAQTEGLGQPSRGRVLADQLLHGLRADSSSSDAQGTRADDAEPQPGSNTSGVLSTPLGQRIGQLKGIERAQRFLDQNAPGLNLKGLAADPSTRPQQGSSLERLGPHDATLGYFPPQRNAGQVRLPQGLPNLSPQGMHAWGQAQAAIQAATVLSPADNEALLEAQIQLLEAEVAQLKVQLRHLRAESPGADKP